MKTKATRNAQIKAMYRAGHSLGEVGAKFTLSRERVRQVLVSLGVTKRHGCGKQRTAAYAEARERAKAKAVTQKAYQAALQARYAQVAKLYNQGLKVAEIAKAVGVDPAHVSRTALLMGCKRRHAPRRSG